MRKFFKTLFRKQKPSNTMIVVFSDYNYLEVLENWIAAMERIDIHDYTVISLDEKLHKYLLKKGIKSILKPCNKDLEKLWIHRVDILLELMEEGHDIIHSDADAVWLKDPLPFLEKLPHDMIFSPGTVWPHDVHEKWGFVLCCGFFFLRSNPQTLAFMKQLAVQVRHDKDDQASCNRLLYQKGIVWDKPEDLYEITFKHTRFVSSKQLRSGSSKDLKIALLPNRSFQRIYEEYDNVYIRHLMSDKNSDDIMSVLEEFGCRFT